jgi:hypothetical protein
MYTKDTQGTASKLSFTPSPPHKINISTIIQKSSIYYKFQLKWVHPRSINTSTSQIASQSMMVSDGNVEKSTKSRNFIDVFFPQNELQV